MKREKDYEDKLVQLGYEPVRIDLMTSISGLNFKQIWKNRIKSSFGRIKVNFIGLNELIKNKEASKRMQDYTDLDILRAAQRRVIPRSVC